MPPPFENLLKTAKECHEFLETAGVSHVICGGLAVRLHGGTRETRDIDLIMRREDKDKIRSLFESAQYVWNEFRKTYLSPLGVRVDFRWGGGDAGNGEFLLPDPSALGSSEIICGLPVLALNHLIATKLACGVNPKQKRANKHFEHVRELIVANHLDETYGHFLHPSVRDTFSTLCAPDRE